MKKLVLTLIVLLFAAPAMAADKEKLQVGGMPPSFVGAGDGYEKLYLENYQGKIVIVTFWASWCAPCLQELPVLNGIQMIAGPERMKVIAVNYKDGRRNMKKIKRAIKDWRIEFSFDSGGHVAEAYGVKSIPHMFMIGHDGKIANIHTGYSESALDGIVNEVNELLLAQAAATAPEAVPEDEISADQ